MGVVYVCLRETCGVPLTLRPGTGTEGLAGAADSAGVTDDRRKGTGTDQYVLRANRLTDAVGQVRADRRRQEASRRSARTWRTAFVIRLARSSYWSVPDPFRR